MNTHAFFLSFSERGLIVKIFYDREKWVCNCSEQQTTINSQSVWRSGKISPSAGFRRSVERTPNPH